MLSSLSSTIKTVLLIGCLPRIVYRPACAIFSQLIQYFVASPSSPAKPFDSDNPPRAHVRRTRSVRPSRTGCRPAGGTRSPPGPADRKSVVSGKSVSVRVDIGGRRLIHKNKLNEHYITDYRL